MMNVGGKRVIRHKHDCSSKNDRNVIVMSKPVIEMKLITLRVLKALMGFRCLKTLKKVRILKEVLILLAIFVVLFHASIAFLQLT